MKKQDIENQLLKVLEEAEILREKSELELDTANFLSSKADELFTKSKEPLISTKERDLLLKQMRSTYDRIEYEIKIVEKGQQELIVLEEKLENLKNLALQVKE